MQYLGSVPVPIYTGKDVLCAAMQKVQKVTVKFKLTAEVWTKQIH